MPIAQSALTTGGATNNDTSYNTASISPSSNQLILVGIYTRAATAGKEEPPSALSGNGLTWVKVTEIDNPGSDGRSNYSVWRGMGASPSTGAITINFTNTRETILWSVVEFSDVDTSGSDGSGAIVQSTVDSSLTDSLTITLAAFSDANNATYGGFAAYDLNPGNQNLTQGAGFTKIHQTVNINDAARDHVIATEFRNDNDMSVDMTADEDTSRFMGVAIELKFSAGSTISWVQSANLVLASSSNSSSDVPIISASAITFSALGIVADETIFSSLASSVFTLETTSTVESEFSMPAIGQIAFSQFLPSIFDTSITGAPWLGIPGAVPVLGVTILRSVTPGSGQNTLVWDDVVGADSFNIYFNTTSGVTRATGTKITNVTSPHVHLGLDDGTTYHYIVVAVEAGLESEESNELSGTPTGTASAVFTGSTAVLSAVGAGITAVPVSIIAAASFAMSGVPAALTGEISFIAAGLLSATGEGIASSDPSFVSVASFNGVGVIVGAVTVNDLLTVTPQNKQNVITFEELSAADSHNIYFKTANSGVAKSSGIKLTGVSSPFTHTGLVNGVTYYYVYTAVFTAGESDVSNELSGVPVAIDRVDFAISETGHKPPCKVATTANITLSGNQTIDGVVLSTGDRVLVKDQTIAADNGIYTSDTSTWQRQPDWDGNLDIIQGTIVTVTLGSTNRGLWHLTTNDPITIGITAISLTKVLGF